MDTKDAGKIGGDTTLRRYGSSQLKEWGKKGGRPPALQIYKHQLLEWLESNKGKLFCDSSQEEAWDFALDEVIKHVREV